MLKIDFFEKVMWLQIRFKALCVLVLGIHFKIPKSFGHFNLTFVANYRPYCNGGNGDFSQV